MSTITRCQIKDKDEMREKLELCGHTITHEGQDESGLYFFESEQELVDKSTYE